MAWHSSKQALLSLNRTDKTAPHYLWPEAGVALSTAIAAVGTVAGPWIETSIVSQALCFAPVSRPH